MHTLSQLNAGELTGVSRLSLSEGLREFPMAILSLADSLEVLDLSNNQLSSLPNEIAQLHKLKIVFASNNLFTELPAVLGKCKNLEMIGFKSNQICDVPAQALPEKLRWLILTDNKIGNLPERLGDCIRLQKLALAGNVLTHLPDSFDQLVNLELLRISANQLTTFPVQLLSLPKLAWFAFAGNPFCKTDIAIKSVPSIASSSYRLGNILGQGASGIIYQAHWNTVKNDFPADIAVKVFKGEVTSDGYPQDELQACLKVGNHPNLVQSLAQVEAPDKLSLIMELIPAHYTNLGLPPTLQSCTRDTFPNDYRLNILQIDKMVKQMQAVFEHLHDNLVCHGDLYAHNTLVDQQANIIFGDFGAASMYQMLSESHQQKIREIEHRALIHFVDDLLSVCREEDRGTVQYQRLKRKIIAIELSL
ncbi:protein kinase [Psychromonas sp. psych-6C06]|uniref:leucine-rich repeat-containing protein kinase family protein n=1 Tax=Psychromonas sp. psych-6C06 TaxID=2058089 RepID=UPI000C31CC03|nr:leucine-rich repeat-containing protein kinase family protein [Psychromonas sp. psych-6C06]PKF61685.1 protein kinase [Psychromonas sp. psych-6C06]